MNFISTPATLTEISSESRVQRFLQRVDRASDRLGLSVPAIVDIAYLRQLPPGTLGRTWADCLDQQHLQPLTTGPRRKQLHDGVHILTGYGTDPIGEAEVQAFLLGAKFSPVHIILSVGLLRLIQRQLHPGLAQRHTIRCRLQSAYQRGRKSRFDPDTWQPEVSWHLPLTEVRTILGIADRGS